MLWFVALLEHREPGGGKEAYNQMRDPPFWIVKLFSRICLGFSILLIFMGFFLWFLLRNPFFPIWGWAGSYGMFLSYLWILEDVWRMERSGSE